MLSLESSTYKSMTARALTILTGASRGLGAAMAEHLMTSSTVLLTLARHRNKALDDKAAAVGASLEQWCNRSLRHRIGRSATGSVAAKSTKPFFFGNPDQ